MARLLGLLAVTALLLASAPASQASGPWNGSPGPARPGDSPCESAPQPIPDPALRAEVLEVLDARAGLYGVVVEDLVSGTGTAVNADEIFVPASLFKLPIMYEAFHFWLSVSTAKSP